MNPKDLRDSIDYESMAENARADADGHAADMERETDVFLKSIHKRKLDQAQQSEKHYRDQAQKARDRTE